MHPPEDQLAQTCAAWGIPLDAGQIAQFAAYDRELRLWNERINLTAIRDSAEIYRRHFLDSLSLARFWGDDPASLADIGSGAGFPGLALKILRPSIRITLVESVGKKADFLRHMADELGMSGVRVLTARAEDVGRDRAERERYGLVTARAVAELRVLVEYGLPLLRVGGRMLAPKGAAAHDEAAAAARAIDVLGGELVGVEPVEIPGLDAHAVVIITKVRLTDSRYPRLPGMPRQRPL
ncbi:16S rRNA (guanine(527)-N(7))-methyltransferase RsmG [Oscillochloris sp. ZM17-4]|uniref:16S rRNA (guanine(527)-N(7))-methyltransferase RsmG n=1 Tax=Oscillochloris sp. ZM17-4 TaxID=2866714 RepID=UPI001C72FD3E|nr:16S rRNA (guanine(527)-N(7))-methyltransferase RsmG [Oscillochloris sp. ZM17-4]MBX0326822.1 16S rRNA (guanine(527)-N(7))-methyltransferase RsmG [Oscillochloris sp. ZM17-4]